MVTLDNTEKALIVFEQIEDELPALVGEKGWAEIGETLKTKISLLRNNKDKDAQTLLVMELAEMLWDYPAANERFHNVKDSLDLS